jgi:integrase/recombinase XerD
VGALLPSPHRFKEKGGKEKELPVHHKLEELLDEYLKATGLGNEPGSLLFPGALAKPGSYRAGRWCVPMPRTCLKDDSNKPDCRLTIRRIHSATGITNFLENDGTLEAAQRIAGHADSRTTKLYDRRGQKVLLDIWRGSGT